MPIFEFLCAKCGAVSEKLVLGTGEAVECPHCGGSEMRKLLSSTSTASGARSAGKLPGPGDSGCCGSNPATRGCVPGSCCGR
jgi:putative FmdB family regulatory protein